MIGAVVQSHATAVPSENGWDSEQRPSTIGLVSDMGKQ